MKKIKRELCALLAITFVLLLCACGKVKQTAAGEDAYILTSYTALPDTITNIPGSALEGETLFLCCWEEADEDKADYYAAAIHTDGSGFEKLPLEQGKGEIPLDIAPDGQGGLWCLCMTPHEEEEAEYALRRYDSAGSAIAETPLNSLMEQEDALRYADRTLYLNADRKGNLYVTVKNAATYCFLFDAQGRFLFSLKDGANPMGSITTAEGQVAVCASKDGGSTFSLRPIDTDRKEWGEAIELGTVSNVFGGADGADYYLYTASEFYACDPSTQTRDKLFTWADLGLASGDTHVFPLPDGRFAVVAGGFSQTQLLSYEFCVVAPGADERTVLTMLSLRPDDSIREAVALFNKSSSEYKVALTDYGAQYQGASTAEWDKAVMKLNTELIAGKIPDLIDLNGLPADAYSRQGLLEDLYPYLLSDPTIRINDYYTNVFDALIIDGRLPYVTSSVRVYTMFADTGIVGTERGWTVDEFAALKKNGELSIESLDSSRLLEMLMTADNRFVDWESGECRFDSEEFIQLLELCKSMPEGEGSVEERPVNCMYAPLFSVLFVAQNNARLAGNANPIGFPNGSGEVMHILDTENKIGFSAACAHKDGAWAFVRSFLEPRMQESGISFPFLKSSFEKIAAAAVKGNSIWRGGMYNVEIREADIALAREILGSANYCGNSDRELTDMIIHMAVPYFAGGEGAKETAAEIQSRAKLYVGEHQ